MADNIQITCTYREQKTVGQGTVISLSPGERSMKALKTFAVGMGVTVICLLVPVLHFVLVPLSLVGSLIMTFYVWAERGLISSATVACPNCGAANQFADESNSWPKERRCPGCSVLLVFELGSK